MGEKVICALLIGAADTEERAGDLAEKYRNCPYVHFIATKENQLYVIYFLPTRQRWWIETIEKKPKDTIGLEKAKVSFFDSVHYPEKLKMRYPEEALEISPCKSRCEKCSAYGKCTGCPATIFFKRKGPQSQFTS